MIKNYCCFQKYPTHTYNLSLLEAEDRNVSLRLLAHSKLVSRLCFQKGNVLKVFANEAQIIRLTWEVC